MSSCWLLVFRNVGNYFVVVELILLLLLLAIQDLERQFDILLFRKDRLFIWIMHRWLDSLIVVVMSSSGSIAFAWTWRCPLGLSSWPWFAQDCVVVDLKLYCNLPPRSSLHFWYISSLRILSPFSCPKSFCCGSSELLFWASLSLMVYLFQHFSNSKADWLTKFF